MPRRGNVPKREVLPDPMYRSVLVTKLINSIMLDGKKGVAQKVVYGAFDIVKEQTDKDPLEVFNAAMENVMPSLEVKGGGISCTTIFIHGWTMRAERWHSYHLTSYTHLQKQIQTSHSHHYFNKEDLTWFY